MATRLSIALLTLMALLFLGQSQGDTLFKNKTPLAIGFGSVEGRRIQWLDCSRSKSQKYVKPPYWVDKADNCSITAAYFGLAETDGKILVSDLSKFRGFFPDAKLGERVEIIRAGNQWTLVFKGRTLQLAYGRPPSEEDEVQNEITMAAGFAQAGDIDLAAQLTNDGAVVLKRHTSEKLPAPPEFFSNVAFSLSQLRRASPQLTGLAHSSLVRLAEYRSSLAAEPPVSGFKFEEMKTGIEIVGGRALTYSGLRFDFRKVRDDNIKLTPLDGRLPADITFKNDWFDGGSQLLDGVRWIDDTFVGTHVRYNGGPVDLKNVLFVNCTFEIVDNTRGEQVANYAALQLPNLVISDQRSNLNLCGIKLVARMLDSIQRYTCNV